MSSRYSSTTDVPYHPDPLPDTRPTRVLVQGLGPLRWQRVGGVILLTLTPVGGEAND